ncbi:uncharacterized protein BO87DRAFT_390335 [Aspergillus neoniger CBS 115656]|uniref:Uncharacterized protein n=1 Tax=Aspergillus neoniger (strain CBS 115656) TaxID=1448310 RepID=A0A318Y8C0_ASPNB|nr:hypothetical protein BO87DRAFT_390335 [Aspergillus neoniger CBS 115656]PYH30164.1 hypothetical protein BO87DRAFT_390335 [Aspergillus neoniger CBS 115656]
MPDFNNVNLIRHFQIPLARAALTPQIQQSLVNMDRIELESEKKTSFTIFARPLGATLEEALRTRSSLTAGTPILEQMKSSPSTHAASREDTPHTDASEAAPGPPAGQPTCRNTSPLRPVIRAVELAYPATLFNLNILPLTSTAISLPADTIIEGAIVDGADGSAPVIAAFTTQTGHVITSFGPGQDIKSISFREVAGISVQRSHPNRDYNSIEVTLRVNRCSLIRGSECRPSSKLESAISAPSDHRTTETAANMITDLARTAASANTGIPLAASASSNGGPSATTIKAHRRTTACPLSAPGGPSHSGAGSGAAGHSPPSSGSGPAPNAAGFSQNLAARSAIGRDTTLSDAISKATDMADRIAGTSTSLQEEDSSERLTTSPPLRI